MLRALVFWRASLLGEAVVRRFGSKVLSGPFEGMEYLRAATEGTLTPRLLGTYECELHPYLLRFAAEGLDCVIDVGSAEGYYAVGMARLMPQLQVFAHDIAQEARDACRALADLNGVADRITIGGEFTPTDFEAFAGRRCLVIVDCEGAEVDLLRPDLSPALAGMKLIVETHNLYRRDALETITTRFAPSHNIVRVDLGPKSAPLPPDLAKQNHLDQLLAVWEGRRGPTPWLVMTPKDEAAS